MNVVSSTTNARRKCIIQRGKENLNLTSEFEHYLLGVDGTPNEKPPDAGVVLGVVDGAPKPNTPAGLSVFPNTEGGAADEAEPNGDGLAAVLLPPKLNEKPLEPPVAGVDTGVVVDGVPKEKVGAAFGASAGVLLGVDVVCPKPNVEDGAAGVDEGAPKGEAAGLG